MNAKKAQLPLASTSNLYTRPCFGARPCHKQHTHERQHTSVRSHGGSQTTARTRMCSLSSSCSNCSLRDCQQTDDRIKDRLQDTATGSEYVQRTPERQEQTASTLRRTLWLATPAHTFASTHVYLPPHVVHALRCYERGRVLLLFLCGDALLRWVVCRHTFNIFWHKLLLNPKHVRRRSGPAARATFGTRSWFSQREELFLPANTPT
jgi:hypothetical protein